MPVVAAPPGLNNIVRFVPPPPGLNIVPNGGALLGGIGGLAVIIGAVDLIGELGGNAFRDGQLDKIRRRSNEPASGIRELRSPPPFNGGQGQLVEYKIMVELDYDNLHPPVYVILADSFQSFFSPQSDATIRQAGKSLLGPISAPQITRRQSNGVFYTVNSGGQEFFGNSQNFGTAPVVRVKIAKILRADGQTDTSGDPPSPVLGTEPAGYTGNSGIGSEDSQRAGATNRQPFPPPISGGVSFFGGPQIFNFGSALGIGSSTSPSGLAGPTPVIAPPPSPDIKPEPRDRKVGTPPPPITPPPPAVKPPPKREEEEERVTPPPPPTPTPPPPPIPPELRNRIDSLDSKIGEIGAISAIIAQQTTPEAQRLNSKNGACDALNSPPCTKGIEDRIKDPIDRRFDLNDVATGSILGNQATQNTVLAGITAKVTSVFDLVGRLFNNSIIDKAMQYITMVTVIHNASMLTSNIASTLGTALDQGLQAFNVQAKMEDKDGVITGVNQVIGKSFENLIKGFIGAENYTALNETWAKANRIYQAGVNLLSSVQSIIDSTTAVAELTSNRVATLMNSIRDAGVVREDAYRSQTPNTTRFNAFMQKLENLEQGTSNLAAITSNVVSVQQSVQELKDNKAEFERQITDKNKAVEDNKVEKKEESVFTIGNFSIVRPPEED